MRQGSLGTGLLTRRYRVAGWASDLFQGCLKGFRISTQKWLSQSVQLDEPRARTEQVRAEDHKQTLIGVGYEAFSSHMLAPTAA